MIELQSYDVHNPNILLPIHFITFHLSKQIHLEIFNSKQLPTVLRYKTTLFVEGGEDPQEASSLF